MPEPKHPLLVFPKATAREKAKRGGGGAAVMFPSRDRQGERLNPRFGRLQDVFQAQGAALLRAIDGAPIEQVVVLEVAGSVAEFNRAVVRSGLEWLLDVDGDEVAPDPDFRDASEVNVDAPAKPVGTKLYLILTDQLAIQQLRNLWTRWQEFGAAAFPRGLAPWRHVFEQLRDVRLWDLRDRVGADTRMYWQDRLEAGDAFVRTEIELWYAESDHKNAEWSAGLRTLLEASQSAIVDEADIPAIRYRAFLADLSRAVVQSLLAGDEAPLAIAGQVMYYRPQVRGMVVSGGTETASMEGQRPVPQGDPIVAVLDGVPLQNHALLGNRMILDDPSDVQANVPAADRVHGTGMASLVLHGDLSANSPTIASRIVVHPILIPDPQSATVPRQERSPHDRLVADVIHVAVKRLVDGHGPAAAIAPSVRVINLSIGDVNREFTRSISPLARLLDWLSWKYRVLFVVPTGNVASGMVELEIPRAEFEALDPDARADAIMRALERDTQFRRLLSPAESINSLTVGGLYSDGAACAPTAGRFLAFTEPWPSPSGRYGPGFLRGVKPDLVAASGRRLFGQRLGNAHPNAAVSPIDVSTSPGVRAAVPSPIAGNLNDCKYTSGTSNAAALVAHAAAHSYTAIAELRHQNWAADALPTRLDAVLMKALVVHTCHWPESERLETALAGVLTDANERKRRMSRLFGYGALDIDRARGCTDERATLIAVGDISPDQGFTYLVPLPHALAGKREWRRLTVTLAWLSSINPKHRDYRRAQLWFKVNHGPLKVSSAGADWMAARRGTIQHEVWTGERASAFGEDAELEIAVSCAADAGELTEAVPYALCVSLEVKDGIEIPIYQEVATRIATRVQIVG